MTAVGPTFVQLEGAFEGSRSVRSRWVPERRKEADDAPAIPVRGVTVTSPGGMYGS